MKSTETFKNTIKVELDKRAAEDPLFAKSLNKEGKNIDDCIKYILNTVQKSGCAGFTDDEIFGMAVHYFDEDNIDIGGKVDCRVVVNHVVELTEEEKQDAKKKALDDLIAEEQKRLLNKKPKAEVQPSIEVQQSSLF